MVMNNILSSSYYYSSNAAVRLKKSSKHQIINFPQSVEYITQCITYGIYNPLRGYIGRRETFRTMGKMGQLNYILDSYDQGLQYFLQDDDDT
jgi:hypothetical protein